MQRGTRAIARPLCAVYRSGVMRRVCSPAVVLLSVLSGVVCSHPADAKPAEPPRSAESIMLHYDTVQRYRRLLARSVLRARVKRPAAPMEEAQTVPKFEGAAVAVVTPAGPRLVLPAALAPSVGARVEVTLPPKGSKPGRVVHARVERTDEATGLALARLDPWPAQVHPLELAPASAAHEMASALTLTRLGLPGGAVLSLVHLLVPIAGREGMWVSDIVRPWGFPLVTPDLELLGVAVEWVQGGAERSVTAGPLALARFLGFHKRSGAKPAKSPDASP